jgi:hypothetical protein
MHEDEESCACRLNSQFATLRTINSGWNVKSQYLAASSPGFPNSASICFKILTRFLEAQRMRVFSTALAIAVMVAGTAHAQTAGGGGLGGGGGRHGRGPQSDQQKADPQKAKAAEQAYQSGVRRIPDPKEKYDPWRGAR